MKLFNTVFLTTTLLLSTAKSNERFGVFSNKFFSDSTFQMTRIKFPLDGSLEDGENAGDSNADTKKVWRKEEWSFFTPAKLETGTFEHNDSIGIDTSKVLFTGKGFGQTFVLRFSKTNGKWFCVWYGVTNL